MATKPRRKDAPYLPPSKGRKKSGSILSPAARAALDRTRRGRAELDERAAGADMRGLDAHPFVFYPLGKPPKPPGLRRVGIARREDHDEPARPDERPPAVRIAPPVPIDAQSTSVITSTSTKRKRKNRCSNCSKFGHKSSNCPDLAEFRASIADKSSARRAVP